MTTSRRNFLHSTALAAMAATLPAGMRTAAAAEAPAHADLRSQRREFSFLHSYESTGRYWKGIEQAGLLRPTTGIRLVHSPFGGDEARFNQTAQIGGELHRILEERKCTFVIDRVTGGSPHRVYDFDDALLESYAALLGEKFLGGQVHETLSNTYNDWKRLTKACPDFMTQPVDPERVRDFFTWTNQNNWLEYGTLEDYQGRIRPGSMTAFWAEFEWNVRRQAARVNNHFTYCEGSTYGETAWHRFYKFGAGCCMAEVGPWASNDSQFFIASLRGAAAAANKPWGISYAPWGPDGCTAHVPLEDSSWNVPPDFQEQNNWPVGPDKGPSTALQRRIFFHACLSGAHALYEEWGAECNLLSRDSTELSSYGRVTRDLLDFQDVHPDVGTPYVPLALVLDAEDFDHMPAEWKTLRQGLLALSEEDARIAALPGAGKAESVCYSPCVVPEIFDIVPSDAPAEVWIRYREVINVGNAPAPAAAKQYPLETQLHKIIEAASALSPFARSSHMPMQINHRESDGAWIVALYNPFGAARGNVDTVGSILDPACTQQDVLTPNFTVTALRPLHAWPEQSSATLHDGAIHTTVGPGGTLILEIHA